ncbi:hypothetical protein MBOU_28440 [Mycobacterium bourgelatii]|uniref:Uncharacterized protein n=2 Tax=Mycobacterium bourgelatii TaxID=1273442 RepID=A0A7I9YQE6_MYCBU|nr:hypothetical protein MBOU_28440 [Mycobacterium bourgelatii]
MEYFLMDHQDPEQRIAELEQLAERPRYAPPPQAGSGHPIVLRRFEASLPFWGSKWNGQKAMWLGYAGLALFFVPMFIISAQAAQSDSQIYEIVGATVRPLFLLLALLVSGGMAYSYWKRQRSKIIIDVTSDGLLVSSRPGEVFLFRHAQLGPWSFWQSMGSALHLQCGPNRFVLGGRDHRLSGGSTVAPTKDVDAWIWATEFDELLATAGLREESGTAEFASDQQGVNAPESGGRTRCALFPNPEMVSVQPFWAPWRVSRMAKSFMSPNQPSLAVDLGPNEMRVVDLTTNEVQASAWLTQVTVVPEFYLLLRPFIFMWFYRFFPYAYLKNLQWTSPVLVVYLPGLAPLSIGCRDYSGKDHLFLLTDVIVNRFS